jgi:hypothetical protein
MLERQRDGVAKAKAAGRYKGRKPTARAKSADVQRLHGAGKRPVQIARELQISRSFTEYCRRGAMCLRLQCRVARFEASVTNSLLRLAPPVPRDRGAPLARTAAAPF